MTLERIAVVRKIREEPCGSCGSAVVDVIARHKTVTVGVKILAQGKTNEDVRIGDLIESLSQCFQCGRRDHWDIITKQWVQNNNEGL